MDKYLFIIPSLQCAAVIQEVPAPLCVIVLLGSVLACQMLLGEDVVNVPTIILAMAQQMGVLLVVVTQKVLRVICVMRLVSVLASLVWAVWSVTSVVEDTLDCRHKDAQVHSTYTVPHCLQ